jgi:hypothetical protein
MATLVLKLQQLLSLIKQPQRSLLNLARVRP